MTLDAEDVQAVAKATAEIVIRQLLGQVEGDLSPDIPMEQHIKLDRRPFNDRAFRQAMSAFNRGDRKALSTFIGKHNLPVESSL